MLKIKDDVPIEILKDRFGFKFKYNENTGEIAEIYKITAKGLTNYGLHFEKKNIRKNIINIKTFFHKQQYFYIDDNILWCNKNFYAYDFDFETLYDLIKADLVEKVD